MTKICLSISKKAKKQQKMAFKESKNSKIESKRKKFLTKFLQEYPLSVEVSSRNFFRSSENSKGSLKNFATPPKKTAVFLGDCHEISRSPTKILGMFVNFYYFSFCLVNFYYLLFLLNFTIFLLFC